MYGFRHGHIRQGEHCLVHVSPRHQRFIQHMFRLKKVAWELSSLTRRLDPEVKNRHQTVLDPPKVMETMGSQKSTRVLTDRKV